MEVLYEVVCLGLPTYKGVNYIAPRRPSFSINMNEDCRALFLLLSR